MRTLERAIFTSLLLGAVGIYFIEKDEAQRMRAERDRWRDKVYEMTPCDQAVEEAREILKRQLQLRNHTIGDQNESGVVAGYY